MSEKKIRLRATREEKIIFIVIGIIILMAIGILLTWYFTKNAYKDSPEESSPPVVEPKEEEKPDEKPVQEEKETNISVITWNIPSSIIKEAFVGETIDLLTMISIQGEYRKAKISVQLYNGSKWVSVATDNNKFIPSIAGLYRYVYTYQGVNKYQTLIIKDLQPLWEIPNNLITDAPVGKEIALSSEIIVDNKPATADVKVQVQSGESWLDIVVVDNKFIPIVSGLYRYVYTYANYEKIQYLNILDWEFSSELATTIKKSREVTLPNIKVLDDYLISYDVVIEQNVNGAWQEIVMATPTFVLEVGEYRYKASYNGIERFKYLSVRDEITVATMEIVDGENIPADITLNETILLNASKTEAVRDNNFYNIKVYGKLEETTVTNPLLKPIGLLIRFASISSINSIDTYTEGVYTNLSSLFDSDKNDEYLANGMLLVWLDFSKFEYNKEIDIEITINGETKMFTIIFKNYEVNPIDKITDEEKDVADNQQDLANINENLERLHFTYDKNNIGINVITELLNVTEENRKLIGLVVTLNDLTLANGYSISETGKAIVNDLFIKSWDKTLDENQIIIWLNLDELTSSTIITITDEEGISFDFTVTLMP